MSDYQKSGVDVRAADQWTETLQKLTSSDAAGAELRSRLLSGIGDYAATFELNSDMALALSCDGVGTKLLWTLEGLGSYEELAKDLLAMNVNDLLCVGAQPLLFLDYLAVSTKKLIQSTEAPLGRFIASLNRHCLESGMLLVGGETAQMPDLYEDGHFDLAGFAVGTLRPSERLGPHRIKEGARVWGWESNGPHSNGYTLLRKLFSDRVERDVQIIRDHFMRGTRLYVKELAALKKSLAKFSSVDSLQAAFHITGSGLLNLLRYDAPFVFELDEWPKKDPQWLQEVSRRFAAGEADLFRTFNCGFGMLVLIDADYRGSEEELKALGLQPLGRVRKVVAGEKSHLRVRNLRLED